MATTLRGFNDRIMIGFQDLKRRICLSSFHSVYKLIMDDWRLMFSIEVVFPGPLVDFGSSFTVFFSGRAEYIKTSRAKYMSVEKCGNKTLIS